MSKAVVPSSIVFLDKDKDNYVDWSEAIEAYLKAQDLWDVVASSQGPPKKEEDEAQFKEWEKKNAAALHAIRISCGTNTLPCISGIAEAHEAWLHLRNYLINPPYKKRDFLWVQDAERSIADEENVDREFKEAYKDLDDALSKSNLSAAIDLCEKYPPLLIKTLPNDRPVLNEIIKLGGRDHQEKVVEILNSVRSDELRDFHIRALDFVARAGAIEIARSLVQMVPESLFHVSPLGLTPLAAAIGSHMNEMANLLYNLAPKNSFWTDGNARKTATVITKSFEAENLDIPLELLESCPEKFILAKDILGKSPLCTAASAPHLFRRTYYHRFLPKCICKVLGPRLPLGSINFEISGMQFLIDLGNAIRDPSTHSQEKIDIISEAFFEAIKHENFNFILMLINSLKPIVHFTNDQKRNMYMFAIAHRRAKIFSLYFWDKRDDAYGRRDKRDEACDVRGDERDEACVGVGKRVEAYQHAQIDEACDVRGPKRDEACVWVGKRVEANIARDVRGPRGVRGDKRDEACVGVGKRVEANIAHDVRDAYYVRGPRGPRGVRGDKRDEACVGVGKRVEANIACDVRGDKRDEACVGVGKRDKAPQKVYQQIEASLKGDNRGKVRAQIEPSCRGKAYDDRGEKLVETYVWRNKQNEAYDVREDKRDEAYVRRDKRDEACINQFFSFDNCGNNMLHIVGAPTPPIALDSISKLTPQMKSELMWFKEVEKLLPETVRTSKNKDGKTPQELFKESNKDLMMEAGKWMKESASSWAIVGPLVITIMFAAALQVPGGSIQEKWLFKVYMVLVAISLFSATISVLKYLEILSANYEEDFLASLRTYSVIIGTLFLSLATMLVAFCMGLFLTLYGELTIFLPIAATFLVGYIICTKLPLTVESLNFLFEEVKIPFIKWRTSIFDRNIGHEVELIFKMLNRDSQQRR